MSNQFPPPQQGQPQPGQPPYGYQQGFPPPQKKKHTVRNIFLAIIVLSVLAIGGCTALFAGAASQVDTSTDSGTSAGTSDDSGSGSSSKSGPKMTTGQANALRAAKNYLSTQPFSRADLIRQLTSPVADKYPRADAVYAVNHVGANWKEQAARSAKNYLETQPFSREGLIRQLTSPVADRYTRAQAEYGVTKAGLK